MPAGRRSISEVDARMKDAFFVLSQAERVVRAERAPTFSKSGIGNSEIIDQEG